MTQQLIIDTLRDRTTEVGPVRCGFANGKSYKTMKQIRERWRELDREEFRIELEAQNFADAIDVILYIEA